MNPFTHRAAITNPAHFFGRRREIDGVLARTVGASKPQCVSVVGLRRIGKSSLFRQLVDTHGPSLARGTEPVVCVYESLEGVAGLSADRFFHLLLRRTERQVRKLGIEAPAPAAAVSASSSEERFSDWLEELSEAGIRLLLFLDEFDVVTMNDEFDAALFGRLRYLAGSHLLAYVTSSHAELADLCHHDEIRQSPFFNVFSTLHLGLLTAADAEELLVVESERAGARFHADELVFLTELAGTHPFHLQQAASALWEAETPGDLAAVHAAFLAEAAPHFRYAVAHLEARYRAVLLAAAAGRAPGAAEAAEVAFLQRRGLIVKQGDGIAPFSPTFGEWVREHGTAVTAPGLAAVASADVTTPRHASGSSDEITRTIRASSLDAGVLGAGVVLDQRYHVVREIGRGGFGVVLEADDRVLGRRVAVKFLRPERVAEGDERGRLARERFLQEARAAGRISHPNVVTVHDIREHDGALYVVMELFGTGSLRDMLHERRVLPAREAIGLALQAAEGLAAAHALGIVHRDVKPDNLLVDASGRLKVVDFGLALVAAQVRLTPDSAMLLTPRYCSPEQVLGEDADQTSDVFSLGCVLHEVLTGAFAFDGSSISAVLYRILHHSPPPCRVDVPGVGPALTSLLRRCLARERSDRPASCSELARELAALRERVG